MRVKNPRALGTSIMLYIVLVVSLGYTTYLMASGMRDVSTQLVSVIAAVGAIISFESAIAKDI